MPYIEEQYPQALETLDELLDMVGEDETHPLYDLGSSKKIIRQDPNPDEP
jgi:hypothetical protein